MITSREEMINKEREERRRTQSLEGRQVVALESIEDELRTLNAILRNIALKLHR